MTKRETIPVSPRALIQRINRKLAKDCERLKTCPERSLNAFRQLGQYYIVDEQLNGIVSTDIDLEDFGRECGALHPWEKLAA